VIFVHACVWYRHRGDADSLAKAELNAGRTKGISASFRHFWWSVITV
jgi:G:T-mismatch repair DNA endonuclease (very short patch repair protein)